jgi:hypothetical protein
MSVDERHSIIADQQVEANARLTGLVGAVLLVVLAAEGVTVLDVRGMLSWHVALGLLVIPIVLVKMASTGVRFFHYYRGTEAFRRKGPPHPILRIAGPLVIVSTVAMLAFGIVTLAVGPRHREPWLTLHQGAFAAWFVLTTVHVLGHAVETWKLTRADVTKSPAVPRRGARFVVVLAALAIGVLLAILSLKWTGAWSHDTRIFDH